MKIKKNRKSYKRKYYLSDNDFDIYGFNTKEEASNYLIRLNEINKNDNP